MTRNSIPSRVSSWRIACIGGSHSEGYAFEVEIFRDLEQSGLRFQPHDLFDPTARRSPHDLRISGFWGDVKTSAYFLLKVSGEIVSSDFFITRVGLSTIVPGRWSSSCKTRRGISLTARHYNACYPISEMYYRDRLVFPTIVVSWLWLSILIGR